MDVADLFLSLILGFAWETTEHGLEEMDDDNLTFDDVISCCATGHVRRSWPRQRKYEIEGKSLDGRRMRVVGRLTEPRWLRIITVYEVR